MSIWVGEPAAEAVARLRATAAAIPALGYVAQLSDASLLRTLKSAERTVRDRIGVLLEPTLILAEDMAPANLPRPPSYKEPLRFSEQIVIPGPPAGILAPKGTPYLVEPGYDYESNRQEHEGWGLIDLRQRQVIEILDIRFSYGQDNGLGFRLPLDWLRLNPQYGTLRIVPVSGQVQSLALNGLILTSFAGGRRVPHAWRITYSAGIRDIHEDYPDLVDFIARMATASLLKDAFPGQSGSISADGLSQSTSFDLNALLTGGGGAGGGLEGDLAQWRRRFQGVQMISA